MNVSLVSSDLTLLQVFLILVVFPPVLEAAPANPLNCNLTKQYILTVNGKPLDCMDCPDCMFGEEPPVRCGFTIDDSTSNKCKPCNLGKTYSSERGYKSCQDCNSTKCLEHEVINGTCVLKSDTTVCSGVCMDGYRMNDNKTKCTKNVEPTTAPNPEKYSSKPTELRTKKQTSNNPTKLKTSEEMLPPGKIKPTMETDKLTKHPTLYRSTHGPSSYKMPIGIKVLIACLCALVVFIIVVFLVVHYCTGCTTDALRLRIYNYLRYCYNKVFITLEADTINESNYVENETRLHTNEVNLSHDSDSRPFQEGMNGTEMISPPVTTSFIDPAVQSTTSNHAIDQSGQDDIVQFCQDYLVTTVYGQEQGQEMTRTLPPATSSLTDPVQCTISSSPNDLMINLHSQEQRQLDSATAGSLAFGYHDPPKLNGTSEIKQKSIGFENDSKSVSEDGSSGSVRTSSEDLLKDGTTQGDNVNLLGSSDPHPISEGVNGTGSKQNTSIRDDQSSPHDLMIDFHGEEQISYKEMISTSGPVISSLLSPVQCTSTASSQDNLHSQEQCQMRSPAYVGPATASVIPLPNFPVGPPVLFPARPPPTAVPPEAPHYIQPNIDPMHFDNVPSGLYNKICRTFDYGPPGKDSETLAEKLDIFSNEEARILLREGKADAIIQSWKSIRGNDVPKFVEVLIDMNMTDLADILKDYMDQVRHMDNRQN